MASLIDGFHLVLGFDTEYVRGSAFDGELPDTENAVVSYQAAIFSPETGRRGSAMYEPTGLRKTNRISLSRFISDCLNASVAEGIAGTAALSALEAGEAKLLMVAHFTRADLPGFRDYNRLKRQFDGLRKTYATTTRPHVVLVRLGNGHGVRVSVTLLDTMLLAPAGAGSLRQLGNLLNFEKLTIPDVVAENRKDLPAIQRMDLAIRQHPIEFRAYATRDAEIAVAWVIAVLGLASDWGIARLPVSIGSMAVHLFRGLCQKSGIDLHSLLGTSPSADGRASEPRREYLRLQSFLASCYHGGRNETYAVGYHEGNFVDWDLSGAYTTAMAQFRGFDWGRAATTTNIAELAHLDQMTCACVSFRFPAATRFPSLPVTAGDRGLLYPLEGKSYCTGPELVVALSQGAEIVVHDGLTIPWEDPNGPRPFVNFTAHINRERARFREAHGKGSPLELLAKETGNSLYGKASQGVADMRPVGFEAFGGKIAFDTRTGQNTRIPPSRITQPAVAALTTGLLRAALSEILARLPDHVQVLSATTDGWLSTATREEVAIATAGPVCQYFASLRAMVSPDGSGSITEAKHDATVVLSMKTRGVVTVAQAAGSISKPILARAGHRLEETFDTVEEEAKAFIKLYRTRTYATKTTRRSFVSIRSQWMENSDLYDIVTSPQVNLCYDMKRRPEHVRNREGIIQFPTAPWTSLSEFKSVRETFDSWRKTANACLVTASDWERFKVYQANGYTGSEVLRSPFQNALLVAWVTGSACLPVQLGRGRPSKGSVAWGAKAVARFLTDAGVPSVTATVIQRIRKKAAEVPHYDPEFLSSADLSLLHAIWERFIEVLPSGYLRIGHLKWSKISDRSELDANYMKSLSDQSDNDKSAWRYMWGCEVKNEFK